MVRALAVNTCVAVASGPFCVVRVLVATRELRESFGEATRPADVSSRKHESPTLLRNRATLVPHERAGPMVRRRRLSARSACDGEGIRIGG